MQLLDCTLRDGANVVGKGFSSELTVMILEGLIKSNIKNIEMGNAMGLGAYEAQGHIAPLTDREYLDLVQPYLDKAEIGMFIGCRNANEKNIELAAKNSLHFLRIGANAGDAEMSYKGVRLVKKHGMTCRYSLMKGYILSPEDLAEEALRLEDCGLDSITIMDSAGTMLPDDTSKYVEALCKKLHIPVGFHGHSNLGLSVANALAAEQSGAQELDCGMMGMARSAGNLATETAAAVFQRLGKLNEIDLYGLLHFIDDTLAPAMEKYHYYAAVAPADLIYGLAGCHSSFAGLFQKAAAEAGVDLYKLIVEVSAIDQKAPSENLIRNIVDKMRNKESES
jgi:4-hydroxy 2-oxovalerate aldolase